MLQTLKTNWRDILAFLVIGVGFAVLADLVIYWATKSGNTLGLASLINYLQGFSRYVAAHLAAAMLGVVLWPTINRFGNDSFSAGWKALDIETKTKIYIGFFWVEGLIAAICFLG
jgi:hypothetical protein